MISMRDARSSIGARQHAVYVIGVFHLARTAPTAYIWPVRIVRTRRYLKDLKRLRLGDKEAAAIQTAIAQNPTAGDVIQGLGGARKMRFALGSKGKRGGGRVIYFVLLDDDTAVLLTAYAKSEQSDLTPEARNVVLSLIKEITDG